MGMQTSFPPLLTSRVKKTLGAQSIGEDTALVNAGFPIPSHTALRVSFLPLSEYTGFNSVSCGKNSYKIPYGIVICTACVIFAFGKLYALTCVIMVRNSRKTR